MTMDSAQAHSEVEPKQQRDIPMYVSYATLTTVLVWIKEMKVTPTQLDRTLWGPKFAGSTGVQLMSGLRFLGLTNGSNNNPTPLLDKLARTDKDGRNAQMQELLKKAYGVDFVNGLPAASPQIVNEQLTALGTTTSTHAKAVSFFVNAAKSCGIHVPTAISKKARIRLPKIQKTPKVTPQNKNGEGKKDDVKNEWKPPGNATGKTESARVVKLPGATVTLIVSEHNVIELVSRSDDLKWFQELLAKFNEKAGQEAK